MLVRAGVRGYGQQTVVPRGLALLRLLRFDHPDQPRGDQAARHGGLFQKNEDIERVAVIAARGRDEPEVVWERCPFGQDVLEEERALSGLYEYLLRRPRGVSITTGREQDGAWRGPNAA